MITTVWFDKNLQPMAVLLVGYQLNWVLSRSPKMSKIYGRGNWLFNKMGGRCTTSYHYRKQHFKVRLEQHRVHIRDPSGHCQWKQKAVCWQPISRLVQWAQFQIEIHLSSTPPGKWPDRSDKPNLTPSSKNTIRESKRPMGVGIA